MMELLPKFIIEGSRPAYHDREALTLLELASTLYGKMNEVISAYNTFTEEITKGNTDFKQETLETLTVYQTALRQEFQDFIDIVDLRLTNIENNIAGESMSILNDLISEGKITVNSVYDDSTESLNYVFTFNGEV